MRSAERQRKTGGRWRDAPAARDFSSDEPAAPPPSSRPEPTRSWDYEVAGGRGGGKTGGWFSGTTFAELGASDEIVAALRCGAERPSHVQAAGFGPIVNGKDVVLADQTGSGKTLAYLAPLVQELRAREAAEGRAAPGEVRALVLAPTAELAAQVCARRWAKLSSRTPIRSAVVTGEHKWRTQKEAAANGLELLVATLASASSEAEPPSFSLGAVRRVVLDEVCARARAASPPPSRPPARPPARPPVCLPAQACPPARPPARPPAHRARLAGTPVDVMYDDDDFVALWETLRAELPERAAAAFITATLPPRVRDEIKRQFPLVEERLGKGLQRRTPACASASSTARRPRAVQTASLAKTSALPASSPTARTPSSSATRSSRAAASRTRCARRAISAAPPSARTTARSPPTRGAPTSPPSPRRSTRTARRATSCTDRASRGMDFPDIAARRPLRLPRDGVAYLRRVGRVTRGGRRGGVTSRVLGRQLTYARALMKIDERGEQRVEVHG